MNTILAIIAVIISGLGLLVSFVTIYLTNVRGSVIAVKVSPWFKVYHTVNGSISLYFTITFFNKTNSIDAIEEISLQIDSSTHKAMMPLRGFSDFNGGSNTWQFQSAPYAIAVPGKSSVVRTLWFSWPDKELAKPELGDGKLSLIFFYRKSSSSKKVSHTETVSINSSKLALIQKYKSEQKTTTVDLIIDGSSSVYNLTHQKR